MAKKSIEQDATGRNRVTTSLPKETHAKLKEFCGREYSIDFAAGAFVSFCLEQGDAFGITVMNRRRLGDAALREAFCGVLQRFTAQVCNQPDGVSRRQTFADTSGVPSAPADGPASRHARAR